MGNLCEKTQTYSESFRSVMPHQWPENDNTILVLKQKLTQYQNKQGQQYFRLPKLMKHKTENRYYLGKWNGNGQPEGPGQIYQPGRFIFDGLFEAGFPEGEATLEYYNKWRYQGNLHKGKAEGQGFLKNEELGFYIEGQWSNQKPIAGIITFEKDPNMLSVSFNKQNEKTALISYRDGRKYQGKQIDIKGQVDWPRIIPHGQGTVFFPQQSNKKIYTGHWVKGIINGNGIMQWKNNSMYEGQYINNMKQGLGKFTYSSENYYVGYWSQGKMNGLGILYNKNGEQLKKGLWKDGKFTKEMTDQQFEQQNSFNKEVFLNKGIINNKSDNHQNN